MKAILGLLLLLFSLSIFGTGFKTFFEIQQHKQKIRQQPEHASEKIKRFILSEEELKNLRWTEEDEFWKEGYMYDILQKKELQEGTWELTCFQDEEESELMSKLFKDEHTEGKIGSFWLPCFYTSLCKPTVSGKAFILFFTWPTIQTTCIDKVDETLDPPKG